jgi:hypothetical protein
MKLIFGFLNILQAHNPERLSKLVIFNAPGVFAYAWRLIKPVLEPAVAEKIVFSDKAKLLELIDAEGLMESCGGVRTLRYPIVGLVGPENT